MWAGSCSEHIEIDGMCCCALGEAVPALEHKRHQSIQSVIKPPAEPCHTHSHNTQMCLKCNALLRIPSLCPLHVATPTSDVLRIYAKVQQKKEQLPSWATVQMNNNCQGDSGTGVLTCCFSYLPKFSVSGLTRYMRFLSVCSGCSRSKLTCCHGEGEKKTTSYWRKPAAGKLKAIQRIHMCIALTWEKQRWRMLAFSFFTARVNLCLLRFSPQNSLLKDHIHTHAHKKCCDTYYSHQHSLC